MRVRRCVAGFCCLFLSALLAGCAQVVVAGSARPAGQAQGSLSTRLASMTDTAKYHVIAKKSVHVSFVRTSSGDVVQRGEGVYRFHPEDQGGIDMHTKMTGLGGSNAQSEMVLLDGVMYMKSPAMQHAMRKLTGKQQKPWLKFDPNAGGAISKFIGPMIKMMRQYSDPTKMLRIAKKAGTIKSTGQDEIDGQQVTRYTISISTKKILQNLPASPLKKFAERGARLLRDHYPMTIWINSDKLPVRTRMGAPQKTSTKVITQTEFTDWGGDVTITAPPMKEVGTLVMPKLPDIPSGGLSPPTGGSILPTN